MYFKDIISHISTLSDVEFMRFIKAIIKKHESFELIDLKDDTIGERLYSNNYYLLNNILNNIIDTKYTTKLFELKKEQLALYNPQVEGSQSDDRKYYDTNNKKTEWARFENVYRESINKLNAPIIATAKYKVNDHIIMDNVYEIKTGFRNNQPLYFGKYNDKKLITDKIDMTVLSIEVDMEGELYYIMEIDKEERINNQNNNSLGMPSHYTLEHIHIDTIEVYDKFLPKLTDLEIRDMVAKRLLK
jgi:hypothetical protein